MKIHPDISKPQGNGAKNQTRYPPSKNHPHYGWPFREIIPSSFIVKQSRDDTRNEHAEQDRPQNHIQPHAQKRRPEMACLGNAPDWQPQRNRHRWILKAGTYNGDQLEVIVHFFTARLHPTCIRFKPQQPPDTNELFIKLVRQPRGRLRLFGWRFQGPNLNLNSNLNLLRLGLRLGLRL